MPVTTKMPAPMEAPIPRRMRSKRPRRRTRASPERVRTADESDGGGRALARVADDQKRERRDGGEVEYGGGFELLRWPPILAYPV